MSPATLRIPRVTAGVTPKPIKKSLGKAGQTPEETLAKAATKNEKALQRDIINLLRLRGIEVIVSRMDKKTSNNVGLPDLLFSVLGHDGYMPRVYAIAIEVKVPGAYLSAEQRKMHNAMRASPNHWTVKVVKSVQEMQTLLDGLGL
jgi:hypothetical protein